MNVNKKHHQGKLLCREVVVKVTTFDDKQLLARTLQVAQLIVANSAFGVWMTKRGMWANVENPSMASAMELENRSQILARTTGDMQALVSARMSQRSKA